MRERHSRAPKPFFFGDVEAYRPPWHTVRRRRQRFEAAHTAFVDALASITQADVSSRVSDQIWQVSHIAYRKYRLLAYGMWFYGAGVIAALIALIVEKQWL